MLYNKLSFICALEYKFSGLKCWIKKCLVGLKWLEISNNDVYCNQINVSMKGHINHTVYHKNEIL